MLGLNVEEQAQKVVSELWKSMLHKAAAGQVIFCEQNPNVAELWKQTLG